MKFVVTGATGFLGRALCGKIVGEGHEVVALSRDAERARSVLGPQTQCLTWLSEEAQEWKSAIAGADAIFHFAGESVAGGRWTPAVKSRLTSSRVEVTRTLVAAMETTDPKPKVLVSASAVGFYGDCGEAAITEERAAGTGFLPELCKQWEAEASRAAAFGVREVRMRIGIVLGNGGALEKMLYPFPIPISPWKLGLGGALGNGRQWMPWVHIDDVVEMFLWAAQTPNIQGAVNVVSPNPTTNADFSRAFGKALHRPALLPVPAFALRLLLGEFAGVLLEGQRVLPAVAQREGYRFRYPNLEPALQSTLD